MSNETTTENIILELIKFRKNMGFSREDVAQMIGVRPWAIKYLETTKKGNITIFAALLVLYRERGFDINAVLDRGKAEPTLYVDI